MKVSSLFAVATINTVCSQWASIDGLVKVDGGYMVTDRLAIREVKAAKNLRNRYQVLSLDQNQCALYRSKAAALAALADLANGGSWELATLSAEVVY